MPIANDLCAFSINNFGYIIKTNTNEVWQYNQSTDTWLQKGNFPGTEKYNIPIAFSFEGKGYYGLGKDVDSENLSDLWEYNPIDDSWIQLTDMPIGRSSATVFLIGRITSYNVCYTKLLRHAYNLREDLEEKAQSLKQYQK